MLSFPLNKECMRCPAYAIIFKTGYLEHVADVGFAE